MNQSSTEPFDLEARLSKIERVSKELQNIPPAYFGPQGTTIPDIGWYVLAAIKKTASLSHAFCTLVRANNFLAATTLVRLQLDTAMRMSGLAHVADIEDAGRRLISNDESFRKLKSRDNKLLSDATLHQKLNEFYPGISEVYEATSSYVHLSSAHIKTVLSERPGTPTLFFSLNGTEDAIPEKWLVDVVDAFDQATSLAAEMIEDFMRHRYVRTFGPPPASWGYAT